MVVVGLSLSLPFTDPNVRSKKQLTPLHFAARHLPRTTTQVLDETAERSDAKTSCRLVIQHLLQCNNFHTEVGPVDSQGVTPLHVACTRGNLPAVEEILAKEPGCVNAKDNKHDTPLHEACAKGNVEIVNRLLANQADMRAKNRDKEQPLHIACKEGHSEIVKQIVKRAQDEAQDLIEERDQELNTPMHLAVESGDLETLKILLLRRASAVVRNKDEVYPIHIAAAQGYLSMAQVLVQFSKDVIFAEDSSVRTPLHHAARNNRVEMIKFLISK